MEACGVERSAYGDSDGPESVEQVFDLYGGRVSNECSTVPAVRWASPAGRPVSIVPVSGGTVRATPGGLIERLFDR